MRRRRWVRWKPIIGEVVFAGRMIGEHLSRRVRRS